MAKFWPILFRTKEVVIMNKRSNIKIAIVEDDPYYSKVLTKYVRTLCNEQIYSEFHFEIQTYSTAQDCIEQLDDDLNIMILDYYLTNDFEDTILTGDDVLDVVNEFCPECKVIVVTSNQNTTTAINLMKRGIFEYIDKNINSKNRVGSVLQKALYELKRA